MCPAFVFRRAPSFPLRLQPKLDQLPDRLGQRLANVRSILSQACRWQRQRSRRDVPNSIDRYSAPLNPSSPSPFSPSLTGCRRVASERDENIAEWIIANAEISAPHEKAGHRNFPIRNRIYHIVIIE